MKMKLKGNVGGKKTIIIAKIRNEKEKTLTKIKHAPSANKFLLPEQMKAAAHDPTCRFVIICALALSVYLFIYFKLWIQFPVLLLVLLQWLFHLA